MLHSIEYTTTVTAFHAKPNRCTHCGEEFIYDMKAQATASSTAPGGTYTYEAKNISAAKARQEADAKLWDAIDLVPCPSCGHYQPDMVKLLKSQHRQWLATLGTFCLLAGLAAGGFSVIVKVRPELYQMGAGIAAGVGVALLLVRFWLVRRYEPNAGDPERRRLLGQSRAYRPEDANRIVQDRQDQLALDRKVEENEKLLKGATRVWIGGMVLLGLAVWMGVVGAGHYRIGVSSKSWPTVEGEIQRIDEVHRQNRHDQYTKTDVSYVYQVGDKTYRGALIFAGPTTDTAKILKQYQSGQKVTVYHDPDDPGVAVLQPGLRRQSYTVALMAGLTALACLFCLLVGWARYHKYQEVRSKALVSHKLWRTTSAPAIKL